MTKVKMLHIPYKGGGPALVDLIAGNAQVLFATWVSSKPHIQSGRIRGLGVSTAKRLTGVDLPTIAEAGVPGFDAGVWYAYLAPAGTPRDIVTKWNAEIVRAASTPEYRKILSAAAIELIGSTPEELATFMKSELVKWARVVKDANVRID
jgi:tripartite-type tricarboxylate transporter receptor subunit TctC